MLPDTPPSRINIRLDLSANGAQSQHELPLKLLCLGPFAQQDKPLKQRDHIRIDKNNFNRVFAKLSPQITVTINQQQVHLRFSDINDFSPSYLAKQIPSCCDLLAMRNLLHALRHEALDNAEFRQYLLQIIHDRKQFTQLHQELKQRLIIKQVNSNA